MKLDQAKQKIQKLEEKHGMNSEEFKEKFQAGELGDEKEYMKWDMLLDAKKELEKKNSPNSKNMKQKLIEKGLTPTEAERIIEIWEKEEKGELETIPAEKVWEELGLEE